MKCVSLKTVARYKNSKHKQIDILSRSILFDLIKLQNINRITDFFRSKY